MTTRLAVFFLALVLSACGATGLRAQAVTAEAVSSVHAQAGTRIREERLASMVEAARSARAQGWTAQQAIAAGRARGEDWRCAISAHTAFGIALGSWVDALQLASMNDHELTWADAAPFVAALLEMYSVLRGCLVEAGVEWLPEVPPFLSLIPQEARS